jgi:hypothetical protein
MPKHKWQRVADSKVVIRFRLDEGVELPKSSLQTILFVVRDALAAARASSDVKSLPGLEEYYVSVSPRFGKWHVVASFFRCLEVQWLEPQGREDIQDWAHAASAHVLLRARDAVICEQSRWT